MDDPCSKCYRTCPACGGKKQLWQWDMMKYAWCYQCGGFGKQSRSGNCGTSSTCKLLARYIESDEYKKQERERKEQLKKDTEIRIKRENYCYDCDTKMNTDTRIYVGDIDYFKTYRCHRCQKKLDDEEEKKYLEIRQKIGIVYCACGHKLDDSEVWTHSVDSTFSLHCKCGRRGHNEKELRSSLSYEEVRKLEEKIKEIVQKLFDYRYGYGKTSNGLQSILDRSVTELQKIADNPSVSYDIRSRALKKIEDIKYSVGKEIEEMKL